MYCFFTCYFMEIIFRTSYHLSKESRFIILYYIKIILYHITVFFLSSVEVTNYISICGNYYLFSYDILLFFVSGAERNYPSPVPFHSFSFSFYLGSCSKDCRQLFLLLLLLFSSICNFL